jgi:hypothetical protein
MYLLSELNTAIERDGPKWDLDAVKNAEQRLGEISAKVHKLFTGSTCD